MTPEQVGKLLQQVTAIGQEINTRVVQLETQAAAWDTQITELSAGLVAEFGVSDVTALDELRNTELGYIAQLYQQLAAYDAAPAV
jgi:lipase chaperone LimK